MSISIKIDENCYPNNVHFIYDEDEIVNHLIDNINMYGSLKGYDIEIDEYDDEWRKKILWSFYHHFNKGGFEIKDEGVRSWIDWLNENDYEEEEVN